MFPAEYSHIHTDQGIYSVLQDNGAPQYSYAKLDGFPGSNDDTRGQGQVHINPLGQGSCGVNVPLTTVECPSDSNLPNCLDVACGELCDGDDECETDNLLNNCGCGINGNPNNCFDVYRKTCDASGQGSCGVNVPLTTEECPLDSNLPNCLDVACGELCDGDDECETDNLLNNCGCEINGNPTNCFDVYRKTCDTTVSTHVWQYP